MRFFYKLPLRLQSLFRKGRVEQELTAELRFHLEKLVEQSVARGMTPEEARYTALRELGGVEQIKEECRDMRRVNYIENLFQDVRYGLRILWKNRSFTLVAVLALALGIGVNTAIFTAYEAVALRLIQAKDASHVVNIYRSTPEERWGEGFSYSDYSYYRSYNNVFSGLIATAGTELVLTRAPGAANAGSMWGGGISVVAGFRFPQTISGSAEYVRSSIVSENYFSVLGINAVRGRALLPGEDDLPGAPPVVMLSENFFERRFQSDPTLLGQTIKLNNAAFTVIGITPRNFMGTNENVPDLWLPITKQAVLQPGDEWLHNLEEECCRLNGRLKPGVTMQRAQSEMTLLAERVRQTHPPASKLSKPASITLARGTPFAGHPDATFTSIVLLVMAAVGLVLLIACANVASLQLARSAARRKEFGMRLAIGAGSARLMRQLLTESALLAMMAGGLGLLLSWWTLRFLIYEVAGSLPSVWGTLALEVDPDGRIFMYTILISLVAGVLFGLAPSLEATKVNLVAVIKEEGTILGGRLSKSRLRDLLVLVQVAVCVTLLICAGLLVRGSGRALSLDPGYETKNVLGMALELPPGLEYSQQKQTALIHQLTERFGTVPGVLSVTRGRPPAGGLRETSVTIDGRKLMLNGRPLNMWYNYVAPNFFDTLSLPIVQGRAFNNEEARAAAPVVLISEATARQLWPGQNPIGKQVLLDASEQFHDDLFPASLSARVIGVTKDVHLVWLSTSDDSYIFLPLSPDRWHEDILVRTASDPSGFIAALGKQVQAIDPDVTVFAQTLDGLLTNHPEFVFSRIGAIFSTGIGLLGLLLASVGIYGMVSYAVVQRTREVGIRMALGANRRDVLRVVLGQSMRPVVLGMALGMALAAGVSHLLKALLFGLSALDPAAFTGVLIFLAAVALFASYLPARRATNVDPMVALRYE
jgi:predicted permease